MYLILEDLSRLGMSNARPLPHQIFEEWQDTPSHNIVPMRYSYQHWYFVVIRLDIL